MKLIGVKGIGSALNRFIEKEDKDSIGCIVDRQFQKTIDKLMSIDGLEDEQVDEQLSHIKQEREKMTGGSAAALTLEQEDAEEALNAPSRKLQTELYPDNKNMGDNDDISDENMPPVIQSTKGTRGRGRASTRGTLKTKTNTTAGKGRGRGKSVVPDSDEEVDSFANQKPVSIRPERDTRAPVPRGKGRYGSVAGFAQKAQPLTQTSIVSAFSRQSQNISNTTRASTNNSAKNRSILYDSDSE